MLPGPALRLSLPSIRDSTAIDLRVYYCASLAAANPRPPTWRRHAAVVAHPYAPMGGCYDDTVVEAIAGTLLQAGYLVVTFNFRGAGRSAGRTSWTAKPESEDFASILAFVAYFAHYLDPFPELEAIEHIRSSPHGTGVSPTSSSASGDKVVPLVGGVPHASTAVNLIPEDSDGKLLRSAPLLIMSGYSYGALVASRLPPLSDILESMIEPKINSAAAQIRRRAQCLAAQQNIVLGRLRANALKSSSPTHSDGNRSEDCIRDDDEMTESQCQRGTTLPLGRLTMGVENLPRASRMGSQIKRETNAEPQWSTYSHNGTSNDPNCPQPEIEEMGNIKSTYGQDSNGSQEAGMLPKVLTFVNPVPAYLLVSPLVGLIAHLASFSLWPTVLTRRGKQSPAQRFKSDSVLNRSYHASAAVDAADEVQLHDRAQDLDAAEVKITRNPTLALYGDDDIFVSVSKLRAWTTRLKSVSSSRFDAHEVQSAGHFWVEKGTMEILQGRIERFATELIARQDGEERKFGWHE